MIDAYRSSSAPAVPATNYKVHTHVADVDHVSVAIYNVRGSEIGTLECRGTEDHEFPLPGPSGYVQISRYTHFVGRSGDEVLVTILTNAAKIGFLTFKDKRGKATMLLPWAQFGKAVIVSRIERKCEYKWIRTS